MNHTEQPPARLRRAVLEAYLQGYDDARAECAADIKENGVLTRRVQELEAQLAAQALAEEGTSDA
jgi:transcription elongation GreA/GreB family factor